MRHRIRHLLAVLAVAIAAPAAADLSLDGIVRMEVIDGGATHDGHQRAALRLTLAEGWKTYWRAPGEAGIPPRFDWRASRNVADVAIHWPAPIVFDQNGMRSIGYERELVLPLEISPRAPDAPMTLAGEMELGLCREVCIPGRLAFAGTLDPSSDAHPAIVAALATRPYSAREAGVQAVRCAIAPAPGGLRVTAKVRLPHTGGAEHAVIESGNPMVWSTEARTQRDGSLLTATADLYHAERAAFALDRSALRITVLGQDRTVDIRGCDPA